MGMFSWIKKHSIGLIELLLLLVGLAGGVYVAFAPANSLMRWYNIDDAFYYYKVAQNVLSGHGFTFDQIHLTNGFHPLWMGICMGVFWLSRFNLILPLRVLVLVSALFNGLTGVFLFKLLKVALKTWPAFIGALTWILLPAVYSNAIVHGMEAAISAFFMVLFLLKTATILASSGLRHLKWTQFVFLGLLGALTILSRLDNLFVVLVVIGFVLLRVRQIKLVVFIDLVLIAFSGFIVWLIRLGLPAYEIESRSIYPMVAAGLMIKPIANYFLSLYSFPSGKKNPGLLLRVIIAAVAALLVEMGTLLLLNYLDLVPTVSKSILLIDALLSSGLVFVHHLFGRKKINANKNTPWTAFSEWVTRNWRRVLAEAFLTLLPIVLLIGAYMILNKVYFGTFTPVSGQIKTWWSTLPNTIYGHKITLLTVLGLYPDGNYGAWSLVTNQFFAFAETFTRWIKITNPRASASIFAISFTVVSILVLMLMNYKHGILARKSFSVFIPALMLGATLQIMYYTTVGYQHTRAWYWIAQMLSMVMLGSVLLEGFTIWMKKGRIRSIISLVVFIGLVVYISTLHIRYITSLAPQVVTLENQGDYLAEVTELEALTEEGSLIGMTGGGSTAYFIQNRTVVNLDGLISSADYFNAIKTGTGQKWLDALPLDYVFGKEYTLTISDPYNAIFIDRLKEVKRIDGPEQFTLFKYVIKE
jgi:hypothetical protein